MPYVTTADANIAKILGRVQSGHIKKFAAYVPGDDGDSGDAVPVVLSNFQSMGQKSAHGLHFSADMQFCLGASEAKREPRKYGKAENGVVKQVQLHLCGKQCKGSSADKTHLGEWFYLAEGEQWSVSRKEALPPGQRVLLTALQLPSSTWEPFGTPTKAAQGGSAPHMA